MFWWEWTTEKDIYKKGDESKVARKTVKKLQHGTVSQLKVLFSSELRNDLCSHVFNVQHHSVKNKGKKELWNKGNTAKTKKQSSKRKLTLSATISKSKQKNVVKKTGSVSDVTGFILILSILSIKRIGLSVLNVMRNSSTTLVPLLVEDLIMMISMVTLLAHHPSRLHRHSHIYSILDDYFIVLS